MMGYTDSDWFPQREFWQAMTAPKKCPFCNYMMNGTIYKWELLEGPIDCKCNSCGREWSVAIPKDPCKQRDDIVELLELEKQFYNVRDLLNEIINKLHGKIDTAERTKPPKTKVDRRI